MQPEGEGRGGREGDAGMRGVMVCYRGCIKAVYAREVDARGGGVTFNPSPECRSLSLNTRQYVPAGGEEGSGAREGVR